MINKLRTVLWRILGIDYTILLRKLDYTLLKNDKYSRVGTRTYDNEAKVWRWSDAILEIGKFCSITFDVNFIVDEGYHSISSITNFPLAVNLLDKNDAISGFKKDEFLGRFEQRKGISIGNDVWIGMGAFIMPGVKIGNGATIAANAVVTKDIPDYAVAVGSPAKIIKMKYENNLIEKLNKIAWWNWGDELIKERVADFYGPITDFVKKYYNEN